MLRWPLWVVSHIAWTRKGRLRREIAAINRDLGLTPPFRVQIDRMVQDCCDFNDQPLPAQSRASCCRCHTLSSRQTRTMDCALANVWVSAKVTQPWLKLIPAPLRARIEHRPHLQKAHVQYGLVVWRPDSTHGGWVAGGGVDSPLSWPRAIWSAELCDGICRPVRCHCQPWPKRHCGARPGQGPSMRQRNIGHSLRNAIDWRLPGFGLAIAAIGFARPDDGLAKLMVAVLGFVMVFKSTEVVKYWFRVPGSIQIHRMGGKRRFYGLCRGQGGDSSSG